MSIFHRGDKNKPASEVFAKATADKERKQEIARARDIKEAKKALVKTAEHLGDIAEEAAKGMIKSSRKMKGVPERSIVGRAGVEISEPFNSVPATELVNLAETRQLFEAAEAGKVGIRIDFSHSAQMEGSIRINFDPSQDFHAQTYQQALVAVAQRVWRQDHPQKTADDNMEAAAKKLADKGGFNNWQEAHFLLDKEMQRFNGLQQPKAKGRTPSAPN